MSCKVFLHNLLQYPGGECLVNRGNCQIFKSFSGWDLRVNFPHGRYENVRGMIWKSSDMNWKIYCTGLKTYTWFTPKHRNGWITFKCLKILRRIACDLKLLLKVENQIQYTNHQMSNQVTNHIYQKTSQERLFHMM